MLSSRENVSGYTCDQLFENADIALYKAKSEKELLCYCDSLPSIFIHDHEQEKQEEMLEAKIFRMILLLQLLGNLRENQQF